MTPLGTFLVVCAVAIGLGGGGVVAAGAMGYGPMSPMLHGGAGMMGTNGCPVCGGATPEAVGNGTLVVMRNNAFHPSILNARIGDLVKWRNEDTVAHTITSDTSAELDSPLIGPGESWTHAFGATGTFAYHCKPHSSGSGGGYVGMTGQVRVAG